MPNHGQRRGGFHTKRYGTIGSRGRALQRKWKPWANQHGGFDSQTERFKCLYHLGDSSAPSHRCVPGSYNHHRYYPHCWMLPFGRHFWFLSSEHHCHRCIKIARDENKHGRRRQQRVWSVLELRSCVHVCLFCFFIKVLRWVYFDLFVLISARFTAH